MWDLYFVCCGSCILPLHWMLVGMRNVLFKLQTINCHRIIANCRGIAWSSHFFFSNRIFTCMLLAFPKPDCLSSLRFLLLFEFIFIAENEFGFLVMIWRLNHSAIFYQVGSGVLYSWSNSLSVNLMTDGVCEGCKESIEHTFEDIEKAVGVAARFS